VRIHHFSLEKEYGFLYRIKVWPADGGQTRPAQEINHHNDKGGPVMGKGDQRTKRGKLSRGTFGKTRKRKKKKAATKND
jgi:ribosomal small subunit protein bTHX